MDALDWMHRWQQRQLIHGRANGRDGQTQITALIAAQKPADDTNHRANESHLATAAAGVVVEVVVAAHPRVITAH